MHQVPHVDIALGDDTIERGDDALIGLLLIKHLQLRLLRHHVGLGNAECGLPRMKREPVDIALLRGDPAFFDEPLVPVPRHLRQVPVCLRLFHRRPELNQRGLRLGDLMIELRRDDLGQQLPLFHAIADVGVALVDIAARAGVHIRNGERGGGCGQCDEHGRIARLHGGHAHARYEIANLLGGRHDHPLLRIGAGCAES